MNKIRSITKSTCDAPLVLLICADEERSWHSPFVEGYNSGVMDASIVCTHMMLKAEELGLGSVWVLLFDPDKVKKAFALPENVKPVYLLPVGYPSADAKPYRPWLNTFLPLEDMVTEIDLGQKE